MARVTNASACVREAVRNSSRPEKPSSAILRGGDKAGSRPTGTGSTLPATGGAPVFDTGATIWYTTTPRPPSSATMAAVATSLRKARYQMPAERFRATGCSCRSVRRSSECRICSSMSPGASAGGSEHSSVRVLSSCLRRRATCGSRAAMRCTSVRWRGESSPSMKQESSSSRFEFGFISAWPPECRVHGSWLG